MKLHLRFRLDGLHQIAPHSYTCFDILCRSCSKDALGHETTVEIDIAGEKFFTTGEFVSGHLDSIETHFALLWIAPKFCVIGVL